MNTQHIAKFESLKLLVLVQFDKNALLIIALQSIFKETARPKEFQNRFKQKKKYSQFQSKKNWCVFSTFSFQKAELKRCDKNVVIIKSANQLIYEYYHDISTAELKAYALIQLAYMFYTVYNRGK